MTANLDVSQPFKKIKASRQREEYCDDEDEADGDDDEEEAEAEEKSASTLSTRKRSLSPSLISPPSKRQRTCR